MELFEKYYLSVIKLLTRRPRSSYEIREYLKKKKASDEVIEKILVKIKEQKFQSDTEFAEWWIDQRTRFRAKSDRVIKMELRQKGISEEILNKLFRENENRKSDSEKALDLGKKYMSRLKGQSYEEQYRKLGGYLMRRGFSWDTVRATIDACLERGYNRD